MRLVSYITTVLIAGSALASIAKDVEINIMTDKSDGKINHLLAGVSQGGNAGSYMKPNVLSALKDLPVKLVRIEAVTGTHIYNLYNPKTEEWNWTKLDNEIENVQKTGAEVIINLFGTPRWMSSMPDAKIPEFAPPKDFKEYANYCAAIVRHVNIEKKYGIKYWEFWNEPSGGWFWTTWKKPGGNDAFFSLYAETARAVKSVDPTIKFGGFGDNAYYDVHYRKFFDYAKANHVPIDFLTIHWYGEWSKEGALKPEMFDSLATKIMTMYKKDFGHDVPLFYSEWNLIGESQNRYNAAQVAAYISSALYWMQQNDRITGSNFFRVEKYRDPNSSLLNKDFNPGMPWRVLKMFTMLPETRLKATSSDSAVTVIAAGSSNKAFAMISRYDTEEKSKPVKIKLTFVNVKPDKTYQIKSYQEQGESAEKLGKLAINQGITIKSDSFGIIEYELKLDPYAVALVEAEEK